MKLSLKLFLGLIFITNVLSLNLIERKKKYLVGIKLLWIENCFFFFTTTMINFGKISR